MDTKHVVTTVLIVIGLIFVYHVVQTKGGVSGFKSGLGIG